MAGQIAFEMKYFWYTIVLTVVFGAGVVTGIGFAIWDIGRRLSKINRKKYMNKPWPFEEKLKGELK